MFDIILIKANNFQLDEIKKQSSSNNHETLFEKKSNYINLTKMKNNLSDIIETISVSEDNLMEIMVTKTNTDNLHYGDLVDCYEYNGFILQIYHQLPNQDDNINKIKKNILGSILTFKKELLYGNVILLKTELPTKNTECKNTSVTFVELMSLLMSNYYHTGVYIHDNNKIEQIYFDNLFNFVDPDRNFNKNKDIKHIMQNKDYEFLEHSLIKFNLKFIYNPKSQSSINGPITRLIKDIARGDGLIISPYSENSFFDISEQDIINILKVSDMVNLKEDDEKEEKDSLGRRIIKNKYRILENRLRLI